MSSNKIDTRSRILKASLELLEASHGRGVRMSDIAKRAKLSRQAIYLHFTTRAELLIATTHYLDEIKGAQNRLEASRTALTGTERLDAFIAAWGGYIPEIYGIAKALLAMSDTDQEAATAWSKRMQDMREGCQAAIDALYRDKKLSANYSREHATDILWTMLSIRNWEQLSIECGWTQKQYITMLQTTARRIFVVDGAGI